MFDVIWDASRLDVEAAPHGPGGHVPDCDRRRRDRQVVPEFLFGPELPAEVTLTLASNFQCHGCWVTVAFSTSALSGTGPVVMTVVNGSRSHFV